MIRIQKGTIILTTTHLSPPDGDPNPNGKGTKRLRLRQRSQKIPLDGAMLAF